MKTSVQIWIVGDVASGKTQIVQMLTDALKEKGVAFIAIDAGDCLGNYGNHDATIKGVVSIVTMANPVSSFPNV